MKQNVTSISEYPLPDSFSTEVQIIADIISCPSSIIEAEKTINDSMFSDDRCRKAYNALRAMSHDGMVIDLPSSYGKIDREIMQKGVIPAMSSVGGVMTTIQHLNELRTIALKRKCYFAAMKLLFDASDVNVQANALVGQAENIADTLRRDIDIEKGTQHISEVLNDLGAQVEETMKNKAEGKVLRVPTGIYTLNYITYGGFNAGNLVILAARPSVGKTAIMLQMAKEAALHGKAVNLFNLEMTNTELAQRLLFSTGRVTPLQMARGEIEWNDFEIASGQFASKPIYLNDSTNSPDEIISRISLNAQAGKCDIAFIDYLGLMQMSSRLQLRDAIAEVTKKLKNLAKTLRIPIVLLCQLNRASASDNRPPMMHDLRDSGAIEQDADIILMLERSAENENGVDMWVRKNRQGKAGDVKIELIANETYTAFADKGDPTPQPPEEYVTSGGNDFDDNSEFPF